WEPGATDRDDADGGGHDPGRRTARGGPRDTRAPGTGPYGGEGKPREAQEARNARADAAGTPPDGGQPGAGAGRSGAGTGTDPELFGRPHDDGTAGTGHFQLAIAARVRTRPGGPLDPSGDTPGTEPDGNPTLVRAQRPEEPAHHMAVPAAWQPLVGRL